MHKIDHADILNAYLSRLTDSDMEHILKQEKAWLHAALNGNNAAQTGAQAGFYAAVCNAVNNLTRHDIELIEKKLQTSI